MTLAPVLVAGHKTGSHFMKVIERHLEWVPGRGGAQKYGVVVAVAVRAAGRKQAAVAHEGGVGVVGDVAAAGAVVEVVVLLLLHSVRGHVITN